MSSEVLFYLSVFLILLCVLYFAGAMVRQAGFLMGEPLKGGFWNTLGYGLWLIAAFFMWLRRLFRPKGKVPHV